MALQTLKEFVKSCLAHASALRQRWFPYRYQEGAYMDSFLSHHPKSTACELRPAPRVIYAFWTGNNEVPLNRKDCLDGIQARTGVPLVLVTPENLGAFVVPGSPLHPGYESLSLIHRADYLRCYFMHHHGGGYTDIKSALHDWNPAFDLLDSSGSWGVGYQELHRHAVAYTGGSVDRDLGRHYLSLLGNGAYIMRSQTPFTQEWYAELHRRMDLHLTQLMAHPGDQWGKNPGYPLAWTYILGQIFHPLCLKYADQLAMHAAVMPSFTNYR